MNRMVGRVAKSLMIVIVAQWLPTFNGTAGTFTPISGSQYTLDVTPSGEG